MTMTPQTTRKRFGRSGWSMVVAILLVSGVPVASVRPGYAGSASGLLRPTPIAAESLRWSSPPGLPGVQVAWVVGSEQEPGLYALRVRLEAGTRIPPHTHPDARVTTVLSGTLYVGFGERFEEGDVVAVPTGAVYVAPAAVPHFLWARDGEVLYQENGKGPTGTVMRDR